MQWLAAICVKRPVFASVIILVLVVVGILGYTRLSVDRFPKVDAPTITVTTRLQGASPKEIETEISDKIEESVNTISGIEDLTSTSTEGVSQVTISFDLDRNSDVAAQEVRDRVNRVLNDLPKDIDQPVIDKMDPDASPILILALVADHPVREVTEYADKVLRRQLESVSGVGQVTLLGGRKRQINIWLDPIRLQAHGLDATDVQQAFARQNVQIPAGSIKSTTLDRNLRVVGKAQSIDEIRGLVISDRDGRLVRVADVARVEDGEVEADTVARRNDVSTVVLSIRRQSGQNIIGVVETVKNRLADICKLLPADYRVDVVRDNSLVIQTSTGVVKEHLALGALFAALVVLLFLGNSRATVISALSIPTSIIATFGIMWATDQTINEISLVALALAVGIVIDDTIIVVENIFRRIEHHDESPATAAVTGTREIGLAVMATTFSLLAVFLPVAFLGGMVGRFLKSFGLTMSFAIAVSLLVSFTLAPAMGARLLKKAGKQGFDPWLQRLVNIFYKPVEAAYMWILRHALAHRWIVVLGCLATMASTVPLLKHVGKDMMPPNEEAQLSVSVRAPEGTSLEVTDLIAERIARQLRALPGVECTLTTIGDNTQATPNLASIYVRLIDPAKRSEGQSQIMERVRRDLLPQLPSDLRVSVSEVPPFGSGGGGPGGVQYVVAGPDLERLTQVAKSMLREMKQIPGIRDVDSNMNPGKPEIVLQPNRSKAGQLGVSVADLSNTLHILVGGLEVSTYEEGGEQYDIRLRAPAQYRDDPSAMNLIKVPGKGASVSLTNLVTIGTQEGPAQINRLNRRRQITLTANAAPGVDQQTLLAGIQTIMARQDLPADYTAGPTAMSKEVGRTASHFITAFALAFVFMYLILAAQFESWLHPLTILLTLPLTLPFALLGLILLGQSFNIFSALGILVLFGVVKKNGILQIDHTNQLRASGMPRTQAILQANRDRLRPILMTTAAFVAGMLPMMLARGIGSAFHNATAGVVVGGQTLSLLLTLIAIPVFYSLFDDVVLWASRVFRKKASEAAVVTEPARRRLAPVATCLLLPCLLVLGSCAVGPNYRTPSTSDITPTDWRWKTATPRDAVPRGPWWEVFHEAELSALETEAAERNQDLAAAVARVEQARAVARQARSAYFPQLQGGASMIRAKTILQNMPTTGSQGQSSTDAQNQSITATTYTVPLDFSYEIDLWGRVRRSVESATAQMQSRQANAQFVLLTLTGDVALNYFQARTLDSQAVLLRRTVELRQQTVDTLRQRLAAGTIPEIDLARAQTDLATAKADLAAVERTRAEVQNALALLCGRPASEFSLPERPLSGSAPEIPAGLPSDLLERRPDIASAERTLAARNAEIGVAIAGYFPVVSLTASGGFMSTDASSLFTSQSSVWSFGPNVTLPIFTGGRTTAEVRRSRAAHQESVAAYKQTVLSAFKDVEDALAGIHFWREQQAAYAEAETAARRATDLARMRYDRGTVSNLEVVDAERIQLQVQLLARRAEGQRVAASIQLIKALGGGWQCQERSTSKDGIPARLASHRSNAIGG